MQKLWVIFLIFSSWLGYSQEFKQEYLIDYISTKEGLSHNYVSQVVSDSLNIKWIASENGLIKYDGVNFTTIKPGPDYPGLHNENIETLFIDSKNNLWIGTKSGGLSRIKLETGELDNFNEVLKSDANVSLRIRAINEDAKGNIWVGTSKNGLFVINNTYNKLLIHYPLKQVLSILKDAHGNMWFGSENSLKKYDPSEDQVFTYNLNEESSIITDIVEDKERNCLWLSTESAKIQTDKVIFRFSLNHQKVEKLNTGIETYFFSTLFLDHSNRLWIGTWGKGLYRSDRDFKFKKLDLVYPPENKKTINYDIILDIHQDKNDVIWISSNFGGIAKLTKDKGFRNLDASLHNEVLKNNLVIHSLYQENGRLWLGTLRNGLFVGDNYQNFHQVDFIKNTKVFSIHKNNGHYFVGTTETCYIMDKDNRNISSLNIPKATAYLEEGDGKMWIGTQQHGLMFVDIKDINNPKIIRQYTYQSQKNPIGSKRITSLIKDSQGNMWVGTYNGICLYEPENRSFISQTNLINTHLPAIINTIFIDNRFIWLGTPDGLYKLDYDKNKLRILNKISVEDGLSNDFICGITSYKNNLWFTTTTSIVRYDMKDNSFLEFDHSDGVYTSQFNIRSFFKDENSRIYAGGTDNVTFFDPDRIDKDTVISSNIILTGLRVNNKRITTTNNKEGDGITLKKNFSYVDKIKLNHKEKSFTIGFTNDNFANKSYSYRYKLQGYQNEWINLKSQNEVHFVGLPPGNYKLLISSSNDLHHWAAPKSLDIKIQYAPWLSPLAFILYFVVFCVIVTSFFFILLKKSKLRNELKKEHELSEAKFTFFTNISHEFRTPLTLITGPIKELISMKGLKTEINEKLITVDKNATRLLNLINQLLDFRKADHGLLKLRVSEGNFTRFTEEVFLCFNAQAVDKNIQYKYNKPKDSIIFPFDRNRMEIVLFNLISNAFKYTEEGGSIKLSVEEVDNFCVMKLEDSGIGMSKEFENKIFDRFYQIQTTNTSHLIGSGIGLSLTKKIVELHHGKVEVKSQENKGTEFTIKFPLHINYHPSDIDLNIRNTDKIEIYEKLDLDDLGIKNLKVDQKQNTVLIVDDNKDIRKYLYQFLSPIYNILEAKNGKQGVEIASKENCDLILCDIMMPEMDGLTACKILKSNIGTSHIPIILLTARSSNMYEIKGLKTGADDFITKPFDPQVVKARIATLLQNRSKIREYFLNKVRFEPNVSKIEEDDSESKFIQKVITAVEEDLLNEEFGIESLTDICFMSQSTLYRKIKSLTGLSLTGFIRSIRLKKAAELILTENIKMSEVSLSVGFNDYKYFRVSFVKQFGCLPSKYKSKIKSQAQNAV
jgi:signal transduction histidine kinase/ligand-binding sensor domain-containing protein/DNA-binding response OmpR family regulator